jgi:hypothetical protein
MSAFDLFIVFGPLMALCVIMAVVSEIVRLGGKR